MIANKFRTRSTMGERGVWRGIAIDESFESVVMPPGMRVVKSRSVCLTGEEDKGPVQFRAIFVRDKDLDRIIDWARRTLRPGWYMHLVQGKRMRIVFRSRVFDITIDDHESIERARRYGIEVGVHPEQLPLEKLFENPFA